MLERECLLNEFVLYYLQKLVDGIEDSELDLQPAPGLNTPRWILGHLAVAADFAAKWTKVPTRCPKLWYKAFGPGSNPKEVPSPAPTKEELVAVIIEQCRSVANALKSASPEALNQPHDFAPVMKAFPSIADFVAHLLTTHPMLHLGQLSVWRRLHGKPAVLGF